MEGIIPTIGGQHGILSILIASLKPGDVPLSEALTSTPVLLMAPRLSLQTDAVALDEIGYRFAAFAALFDDAELMFSRPTSPLGLNIGT